jgi:hypothetical protein
MSIQLAVLKSGEDIIADIKEIHKEDTDEIVAYLFIDPLVLKTSFKNEPVVLNENSSQSGNTTTMSSKLNISFYPWIPLSATNKIPCAADWVVTVIEPVANLKNLYLEKINGRTESERSERSGGDEINQESIDFNE